MKELKELLGVAMICLICGFYYCLAVLIPLVILWGWGLLR